MGIGYSLFYNKIESQELTTTDKLCINKITDETEEIVNILNTPIKELYIITNNSVLGYAYTLEEAKKYIDNLINNDLSSHYLDHTEIERKDSVGNDSRIHTVTVHGSNMNFLFPYITVVCQYSIYKTYPV